MEFNEKLQKLRTGAQLTQEELAEKLYVSRTAISKWESGRGYPSIDSLKIIAKYFNVSIDELIAGDEMVALAEQDKKESKKEYTTLMSGVLDCLVVVLFLLPVFGDRGAGANSTQVFALTGISSWIKVVYIVLLGLAVLNGFCTVVISGLDKPGWNRHRVGAGMIISIIATMFFILSRQPYAGFFFFSVLIIKGFLLLKSK